MTDRLEGDVDRFPWLTVRLYTSNGVENVRFVVDTGFDGEIALPQSYSLLLRTSGDFLDAQYADGVVAPTMVVPCRIEWLGGARDVVAMYVSSGRPLIGMELLDDCLVTLDIQHGEGSITVEAN